MPGQQHFPLPLTKELGNRVNTWLMPIYGYSEEEELCQVAKDAVPGEHAAGLQGPPAGQQSKLRACKRLSSAVHAQPVVLACP